MNLSNLLTCATPIIRGRGVGIGTTDKNVHGPIQLINWSSVLSAAAAVDISSSSTDDVGGETPGTGARTVRIFGLDANYNHVSEDLTLNGQTKVSGTQTFIRVFAAEVMTTGAGKANAGTIYLVVKSSGGTYSGGVPGTLTSAILTIPIADNVGTSGAFTAPRGQCFEVTELILWGQTQAGTLKVLTTGTDGLLKPEVIMDLGAGVSLTRAYPNIVIAETQDIYVRAAAASSAMTAGFALKLRRQP